MERDPASASGTYDRVRLHILSWPAGVDVPSAVWVMELSDVDWRPPEGWRSEIEHTLSDPGDDGDRVTADVEESPQGAVLNIVTRTAKGTAQLIADRHQASSLLEAWAGPRKDSNTRDDHYLSDAVARGAVLLVLESHFGIEVDAIDSVTVDFEPGEEWLVHVRAGASRYVGTVSRQGRGQVSHVVNQTDANTDRGGAGAV